jgi:RHS repeat-associated protein
MGGRSWSQSSYRFGFQGQETEQEFYGGAVSYKYRVHDPRIGRFLSIDPLAPEYPHYSPYMFSGNRVIDMVELEGLEPEKDDPEYGFHIVLGGPQHEAAISNERVQLFDKSETNSNWIYREAKSLTMANQQIQNLREEMGDKWNKPVDVMLSTHGFTNAILGAGVPGMYLPLEFMEGAVQISNIHIDSYLEGDEGWVNILANKGSSPSVQQVAEIKALENLMASLPEGSNLILSACIVCSGDPEEDVLGKSLVELGKGRINIFLQTNFSINPVDEKATEFTEEAFENIRYLNVPLSIPKYVRDVENSGFVKFHRDGSGAKYLKKDLMLNSSDQPAFDTTDLNEN